MNCSRPALLVHHQLPEFTQTHAHRVRDAIQPSHPLSSPSRPALLGDAHENWVLCPKDTALGAASVLEILLANIALCSATPEIRRLFTAGTCNSVQTSHTQRNVIWCKK